MKHAHLLIDAIGIAGLAALSEGAREIYHPAGWIVAGLSLVGVAVFAALGRGRA